MRLVTLGRPFALIAVALATPATAAGHSSLARSSAPRRPSLHKAPSATETRKPTRCHRRPDRRHRCILTAGTTKTTATAESGTPAGDAPILTITGTTYYVSSGGSDSNSGTNPSAAWRTVKRVNRARLAPGDGVLFEGGATFTDETLMPSASGAPGSPIIFASYGQRNATLPQGVWFRGNDYLAFEHLTIGPNGNLQGTGDGVTVEWCSIGNDSLAINAMGSHWTIDDNTVDHTGDSGMLLEGDSYTVSGNTITNTGLDPTIPYGKHGIYLRVSNARVTGNTITNFSADGISVRYRNSVLSRNRISDGPIGIAWFQYDAIAGTSDWTGNTITGTTGAGIYVSPSDIGGETRESFVIERNTIRPFTGVFMNLHPTAGSQTKRENTLL
jgi:parallel beta-helix repeat protein